MLVKEKYSKIDPNFGNEEILNDLDKDDDKKNYKNISHKKDNTQIEKEKNDADDESNKEVKERDEEEERWLN